METWYIAEGGLHCTDAGDATRSVHSPFVQEALQRNERARQLDGWKTAQAELASAAAQIAAIRKLKNRT